MRAASPKSIYGALPTAPPESRRRTPGCQRHAFDTAGCPASGPASGCGPPRGAPPGRTPPRRWLRRTRNPCSSRWLRSGRRPTAPVAQAQRTAAACVGQIVAVVGRAAPAISTEAVMSPALATLAVAHRERPTAVGRRQVEDPVVSSPWRRSSIASGTASGEADTSSVFWTGATASTAAPDPGQITVAKAVAGARGTLPRGPYPFGDFCSGEVFRASRARGRQLRVRVPERPATITGSPDRQRAAADARPQNYPRHRGFAHRTGSWHG